jgi:hypothetical protein
MISLDLRREKRMRCPKNTREVPTSKDPETVEGRNRRLYPIL